MKENYQPLSSPAIRIISSILYGLSFSAIILDSFFRLTSRSLSIKFGLVFGSGMILGLFFYFLIFPLIINRLRTFTENTKIRIIGLLLLIPGLIFLFVGYKSSQQPTVHHLEITYTENVSSQSASQQAQLIQLKLSKTGTIPFSKIAASQQVGNKKNSSEISALPLPIDYRFNNAQDGDEIEILLLVAPPGVNITIQLDGEKSFYSFNTDTPDQVLRSFPLNHYLSSLEILFFVFGILCVFYAMINLFKSLLSRIYDHIKDENPIAQEEFQTIYTKIFPIILSLCLAAAIALICSAFAVMRQDNYVARNMIDATTYTLNDWKIRDKVYFVLFYVISFAFTAFVCHRFVKPVIRPLVSIIAVLTWLPIVNHTAFLVMQADPLQVVWLGICVVSLMLIALIAYTPKAVIAWAGGMGYIFLWLAGMSQRVYFVNKPVLSLNTNFQKMALFCVILLVFFMILHNLRIKAKIKNIFYAVAVAVILFLIIMPASPTYIAADMATDAHAPFHLHAPALYSRFARYLTPGFEYFTQYGVGAPYLFTPLLGDTPAATIHNYVLFIVALMFLFYMATYFILRKILDSSAWAFGIVLISFFLQFWGIGFHLRAPSMLVFRYALFPFILGWVIYWVKKDFRQWMMLVLAMLVGFSVFWTTETGISFFVTVCALIVIFLGISKRSILLVLLFSVESLFVFFGLSAIAFGGRVFSINYIYEGVLSPIIIYGGGYGALPIKWQEDLSYFCNFFVPMISVASIGTIYYMNRSKGESFLSISERALLIFCSVLGILFSAKYLNRSYLQNWHATVLPSLIVVAYWCKRLAEFLSSHTRGIQLKTFRGNPLVLNYGHLVVGLTLGLGIVYLFYTPELQSGTVGFKSYASYDSLLNHYAFQISPEKSGIGDSFWVEQVVSPKDVALIQKYSEPSTPVMLIGFGPVEEWQYFLMAKRIPASPVVPMRVIFSRWQSDVFFAKIPDIIFLPYKDDLYTRKYIDDVELNRKIKENVIPNYVLIGEADTVYAFEKR